MLTKVVALGGLSIYLLAGHCNTAVSVTIVNDTSGPVFAEINGEFGDREILGGERQGYSLRDETETFDVLITTEQGKVLFDDTLTREEMEAMDFEIKVSKR